MLTCKDGCWRFRFTHARKRHTVTFGKVSQTQATCLAEEAKKLLLSLRNGSVTLPAGMNPATWIFFQGEVPGDYVPPGVSVQLPQNGADS